MGTGGLKRGGEGEPAPTPIQLLLAYMRRGNVSVASDCDVSVCDALTFESLDIYRKFIFDMRAHLQNIYRSPLYVKVIGSRSG